jgi:hypothetical protein
MTLFAESRIVEHNLHILPAYGFEHFGIDGRKSSRHLYLF